MTIDLTRATSFSSDEARMKAFKETGVSIKDIPVISDTTVDSQESIEIDTSNVPSGIDLSRATSYSSQEVADAVSGEQALPGKPVLDNETETFVYKTEPEAEPSDAQLAEMHKTRRAKIAENISQLEAMIESGVAQTTLSAEEKQAAIESGMTKTAMGEYLSRRGIVDLTDKGSQFIADAKRAKYIETELIPSMEDSALKSFFKTTGATGYETIVTLGNSLGYGTAAFTDGMQAFFEQLQNVSPEGYDAFAKTMIGAKQNPEGLANGLSREIENIFVASEGLPALGAISSAGLEAKRAFKQVKKAADYAAKQAEKAKTRFDVGVATEASAAAKAAKREAAAAIAKDNQKIKQELIVNFEQAIGARSMDAIDDATGLPKVIDESKLISTMDGGDIVLDTAKARDAGRQLLQEKGAKGQRDTTTAAGKAAEAVQPRTEITGVAGDIPAFMLDDMGQLTIPVVKAKNIDAFTAVTSELLEKVGGRDPNKRLVDQLFEVSVNEEVLPAQELVALLNKYDLSFEDYATMTLGSASEAGKILNKFSQVSKRVKPKNELLAAQERAMMDAQKGIMMWVRRVENVRRGLLVSQLATAARNLESGMIRAPLEGLQNMLDTALYNMSNADGVIRSTKAFGKTFVPGQGNWTDSFRHMRYMFDPTRMKESKEFTDYVLKHPELSGQFDMMFNQVNEVRKYTGAGSGGMADKIMSGIEQGVDVLNTPNRWQEYLIRRGAYTGELERLVKREYGVELMDVVNQGKIQDLLNDSPEFVKEGKQSFIELSAQAAEKAVDITYAKQPDTQVFRDITSFITRNGLTVAVPFPRFMFNSMELAGNYAGGAFAPVIKRGISAVTGDFAAATGKITNKERKQISRNIIGATVLLPSAMMYRNSEDAPEDYKKIKVTSDGTELDISNMSPVLRQSLWVAELMKRTKNGTVGEWLNKKDTSETWLGTNVRTGAGGVIFNDITDILAKADSIEGEKWGEYVGEAMGEYATTYLTPINQLIELQRAMEYRTDEYKDSRKEPQLGDPFIESVTRGFIKPAQRRGYAYILNADEEAQLPARETLYQKESEPLKRTGLFAKIFFGLSLSKEKSEAGKYMENLGLTEWEQRPKTISPGMERYEVKFMREYLPNIVEVAQTTVYDLAKEEYDSYDYNISEEKFINQKTIAFLKNELQKVRANIDGVIEAKGDVKSDLVTPEGKPIDITLTQNIQAQQRFRKLPKHQRRDALNMLPSLLYDLGRGNEEPDLSNAEHIDIMVDYAKQFAR